MHLCLRRWQFTPGACSVPELHTRCLRAVWIKRFTLSQLSQTVSDEWGLVRDPSRAGRDEHHGWATVGQGAMVRKLRVWWAFYVVGE